MFGSSQIEISPNITANHYQSVMNFISTKTLWRHKLILQSQNICSTLSVSMPLPFFRASSGGVSRAMQPTPAPVRRTAWSTAPAATAASTAGCRSAWQWACHEMVSVWWKRWVETAGWHSESGEVKSPGSSPPVWARICWSAFEPALQRCCVTSLLRQAREELIPSGDQNIFCPFLEIIDSGYLW